MKNRIAMFVIIMINVLNYNAFSYDIEENLKNLYFQVFVEDTNIIDFELEDLNGNSISLSSYNGKIILLSFWATWCPPCREEMVSMQKLYELYNDSGFEIVAVNLQENKTVVNSYINENEYTFDVLLDPIGISWQAYGTNGIPTNYLINPNGTVLARTVGGRDWFTTEIIELIDQIINQ